MWRMGADLAAPIITTFFEKHWAPGASGEVPHNLKDAFLAWLAKPGKDATRPGGLRPIGLIGLNHPVSKTLCAILRDKLIPLHTEALRTRPQFAYTQGRGTMDLRAHGHMQDVKSLIQDNRKSIYALHAGAQQHQCVGGLTFSLDLEGAFDAVPRSLINLGVEDDIVHLLMQFHHDSRYHFRVGDAEAYVTTTCGIKQGCRVAPYLLSLTIQIMDCLSATLGVEWLRTGFTFYADGAGKSPVPQNSAPPSKESKWSSMLSIFMV